MQKTGESALKVQSVTPSGIFGFFCFVGWVGGKYCNAAWEEKGLSRSHTDEFCSKNYRENHSFCFTSS